MLFVDNEVGGIVRPLASTIIKNVYIWQIFKRKPMISFGLPNYHHVTDTIDRNRIYFNYDFADWQILLKKAHY